MLYDLIGLRKGKETVWMTDQITKVRDRMKTLRTSHRKGIAGDKVQFFIREAENDEKFKKAPHNLNLSGGPLLPGPPKIGKRRKNK